MSELLYIILLPILAGIVLYFVPDRYAAAKGLFSAAIGVVVMVFAVVVFLSPDRLADLLLPIAAGESLFQLQIDPLSKLVLGFSAFFALLILLYSIAYVSKEKMPPHYYSHFLITMGSAAGAILADNLLLFIFFWGVLGFTLYMLIKGNTESSSATAKKTFILIGASDGLMILGMAILWEQYGSLSMSALEAPTYDALSVCAFLCLLAGAFTKAGAFPLHTWVPDYAEHAPASSSAYLPASLDKLLGIYFMARICNDMFILNQWLTLTLLIIGVSTIIIAVLMALVQHNYKRLLGYHAVSQVGYMVTGLALGTPLGIAGGLFHMINNALYKGGLFLSAGAVEKATGKENIEDVGGLSKAMPLTFFSALIFALSISGIPPLNGFASKWLIYQGIIEFGQQPGVANQLWMVWLGLAVFGSALTLASFMKFIGGIFWGPAKEAFRHIRETNILLLAPQLTIALLCIVFGVFASNWVIPKMIMPVTGEFAYFGVFQSTFVGMLVLVSIVLGWLIYWISNVPRMRVEDNFVLGEQNRQEMQFSTLEFYKTISQAGFLAAFYDKAEKKWFDVYDLSKRMVLGFSHGLSAVHTGVLPWYAIWIVAGLLIMLILFM